LGIVSLFTLACHGITTPSSNQSENFSGTLQPHSNASHPFNVSKTGEFTVKLTSWGPNSSIFVGLAWTDSSCSASVIPFQRNDFVLLNTQALGGQIVSGKYCVIVYDPGTLTAAQTYTINVSHP